MFLVALLRGTAEDASAQMRLAAATAVTAYEVRLALAGGFPAIVLTTQDQARANALAATLQAGGDDAIAIDGRAIVPAEAMVPFDHFAFEAEAVVAGTRALPYADVACLLRAVHRARTTTQTQTSERKFDVGKSLLSGGLANSKVVTKTHTESSESRESVLYVFRRSGETPWLLRETHANYEGLGGARGLTAVANFATTVRLLRERAPHAAYDERLMQPRRALERSAMHGTAARGAVTSSSASGIDALAYLVAIALASEARDLPFRV